MKLFDGKFDTLPHLVDETCIVVRLQQH